MKTDAQVTHQLFLRFKVPCNYVKLCVGISVRLSPSDGDSLGSDQSSGRESAEESTRPVATPSEGKQHRKMLKNGQNIQHHSHVQ